MLSQIRKQCVEVWKDALESENNRLSALGQKHGIQSNLVSSLWDEIAQA